MATQGPAGAAQWRMNTPEYNFAPGIVDRSSPATFQRNAYWCRDHAFSQTKQRLALPDAGLYTCRPGRQLLHHFQMRIWDRNPRFIEPFSDAFRQIELHAMQIA